MELVPWEEENDAAAVVESRLGGEVRRVDQGGGAQQLHDFDVHLGNGRIIAVEVTRHNVEADLKQLDAVTKHNSKFATLNFHWVVDMVGHYQVRGIRERIVPLLGRLESEEVESAHLVHEEHLEGTQAELRSLGAGLVYRLARADDGGGEVILSEASQGAVTAPEVVAEVLEFHANCPDNAKKLKQAADATERHLFVWVENSQHQAVAAMGFGFLPQRAPALPHFVDAAWAVTALDTARIWRYRRDEWLNLGSWQRPDDD